MTNVASLIRTAAGTNLTDKVKIFDAIVTSIDNAFEDRTCMVTTVGGNSSNSLTVRLMSSVDDGCLMIPTVGSTVVCLRSEYVSPVVIMYSEIGQIVWMGGEYEGVPIVIDPNDPTKGVLKKLNDLESKVKDLQIVFSSWTVAPTDGGAALKAAAASWYSTPISLTTQDDISHPNITH